MVSPPDHTSPTGLWTLAKEFAEAGEIVAREKGTSVASCFLSCHAVELVLKAFLRARGASLAELKKLGHDLERCLDEAMRNDLGSSVSLDEPTRDALVWFNLFDSDKRFEYPRQRGHAACPSVEHAQEAATLLLKGTRNVCRDSYNDRDWSSTP